MPNALFRATCIGFPVQYQGASGPRPAVINAVTNIGEGGWGTGVDLYLYHSDTHVSAVFADEPGVPGTFIFPGGVEPVSHAFARQVDPA